MASYSEKYFLTLTEGAKASAEEIVPLIQSFFQPKSVADVGCGNGAWLTVWEKSGVKDYCGFDGHYVKNHQLLIDKTKFVPCNLEENININRKFDLVQSLEVAEHLSKEKAAIFIKSLCNLGDIILFSAAMPHQGGVNHFNEQYPEYWAHIFKDAGFKPFDSLRELIWNNKKISFPYRQNIVFYIKEGCEHNYPLIANSARKLMPIVHPELYELKEHIIETYKKTLRSPFHAGWYFVKSFFRIFKKKYD